MHDADIRVPAYLVRDGLLHPFPEEIAERAIQQARELQQRENDWLRSCLLTAATAVRQTAQNQPGWETRAALIELWAEDAMGFLSVQPGRVEG